MALRDRIEGAFKELAGSSSKSGTDSRFVGTDSRGAVIVEDVRGKRQSKFPTSEKSEQISDDPLAIYKPDGAKSVGPGKAMHSFTGYTYAAVNAIASETSNIHWRLFEVTGEDHEEVPEHEMLTLLDAPNPHTTGVELKYIISSHLELAGNAFLLMTGVKNWTDKPKELHALDPGKVRVKIDKTSFPYKLSHYEMTLDTQIYKFQPYEIIHLKYPDPSDPFSGLGIPQAIPVWIDSDNYAMEYNRKYFLNGAQLGLYIATNTNVEGQIARIKEGMRNEYAGSENAHKIPVLPKGVDLKSAGATNKDMDFKNLSEATRDRILSGFRVSKTILGTAESDTNRSTAETADYVFSKRTIKPKMLLQTSFLNAWLVPRYTETTVLYLTFLDPVPEDKAARTTEMQAAAGSQPIMTQNEARRLFMGLGPVEGGDKLMHSSTMVADETVPTTDKPEGDDSAPNLVRTAEGRIVKIKSLERMVKAAAPFRQTTEIVDAVSAAFAKALGDTKWSVKSITELSHADYMEHWKRFDARASQAQKDLTAIFHNINQQQRKEVIANLSTATGVKKDLDPTQLFDPDKWLSITVDLTTPILTALTVDEAAAAISMIGAGNPNILGNPATQQALDNGIELMAASYTKTTLDQLKDAIGAKLSQAGGTNLRELTDTVDGVYDFADERRAGLIAKTESYRAANFANLQAWQQSGVVKTVKWYTAEDNRVCPTCAELDGTVVETGAEFFAASYGSGNQPPAHPDCRCYIRPASVSIE